MNTPSWQTMGLTLREEFQSWTGQLLEGLAFPNDWIAELQTLERLAVAVDSLGEIETGFWELEAGLTSDFLPSGEGRGLHQEAMNTLPSPVLGGNLKAQRKGVRSPGKETSANLPLQNASFEEASQMATTSLENGWNGVEASSSVSSTQSLPNGVARRPNSDTPSILNQPSYSSPSLPDSLSHSTVASSAPPNIPSPPCKPVTQEPNLPEMGAKSAGKPWVTVTPVVESSPVESTFSTARPVVRAWMESDAANSTSNVSPLAETSRPKSLGDLANLLSLAPAQSLEWEDDDSEASLEEFPPQAFRKREVEGMVMHDAIPDAIAPAHPFAEPNRNLSNFEEIPPVAINRSPSPEMRKVSTISPTPETPANALPVVPELDLEEVLEAVQRQVNQEYRRFYGG